MSKTSGAEQTSEINKSQKIDDKFNKVKNLSWLDASSWLFTSAAKVFELLTIHWTKKRIYLYSKSGANHLQMPHLLNFAQFCHMT